MKTSVNDKLLQDDVMSELDYDPKVDAAHIGVSVDDGAVTLTGHVRSHAARIAAVRAAERIYGVTAVADEIEVRLPSSGVRNDTDIAEAIASQRNWNTVVPASVDVEVRNGWVTLRGEVDWPYQREEAEGAVIHLQGVCGVTNKITIKPRPNLGDVEQRVHQAFQRQADIDARSIWATAEGGTVTLHGNVRTFAERRHALHAAEAAPGVTRVVNRIFVLPGPNLE